jgi:hypothetical protein
MSAHEHRRVANQMEYTTPETDRLFAEAVRRLLLKVVAMVEDRYRLTPISRERKEERATRLVR